MIFFFALLLVMAAAETSREAEDGEFPYQVSLGVNLESSQEFAGGGSIISHTFIITAAQCVKRPSYEPPVENFTVYLGSIYGLEGTQRAVRCIHVHPGWDMEKSLLNNIALLQVDCIQYASNIESIALPDTSSDTDFEASAAVSLGWGMIDSEDNSPAVLRYTALLVISNVECALAISPADSVIEETHICASAPSGTTPCHGDSGGPLVHETSNTLIGIILDGPPEQSGNCNLHEVTVFTRITSYRQWIKDISGT